MAALGVGLVFIGYALGLHGYCLFKGYDITFKELWSPAWPPGKTQPDSDEPPNDSGRRGGSGTF